MQTIEIDCSAKGGVKFQPTKSPNSRWGRWECWMHCEQGQLANGTVGLVPTGDWLAWDSLTNQQFGFPEKKSAEQMCALQNNNMPTRIVDPWLGESESEWTAEKVRALLPEALH